MSAPAFTLEPCEDRLRSGQYRHSFLLAAEAIAAWLLKMDIAGLDLDYKHVSVPITNSDYQVSEIVANWSEEKLALRLHRLASRTMIQLAGAIAMRRCFDGEGLAIGSDTEGECRKQAARATHLRCFNMRDYLPFISEVEPWYQLQFARAFHLVEERWETIESLAAHIRAEGKLTGQQIVNFLEEEDDHGA